MRKGNGILVVIVLVVIGVLGILLLVHRKSVMNQQTTGFVPTPTYQATTGDSNSDLQQDMNTVNTSFNSTSTSTTDVNSGINDTPIAQPNY